MDIWVGEWEKPGWSVRWGNADMKDDKSEEQSEGTTTKLLSCCNFLV